jgi:hypothetical protein
MTSYMVAKTVLNMVHQIRDGSLSVTTVIKPMPARLYQGIQCHYRRCRKMIALKALESHPQRGPQLVIKFAPFVLRCPHCMRYQLCQSEHVEVFEGPLDNAAFHNHPKLP